MPEDISLCYKIGLAYFHYKGSPIIICLLKNAIAFDEGLIEIVCVIVYCGPNSFGFHNLVKF